jgi:hypothetical protein
MAGSIGGAIRQRGAARTALLLLAAAGIVASCGRSPLPPSNAARPLGTLTEQEQVAFDLTDRSGRRGGFFDLFRNQDDANVTVEVNRYLWNATLEILDFLPVESADPFSGVITYGFGTPPGGGQAYRATVLIRDPALDARSLSVALATRGGPASAETTRAVEDAILTRARQLRIADSRL